VIVARGRKASLPTHIHDHASASPLSVGEMPGLFTLLEVPMSTTELNRKLDELDRLLNDPDVPMQPDRIWALLADVSRPETHPSARPATS
jgi:hypothetical protein